MRRKISARVYGGLSVCADLGARTPIVASGNYCIYQNFLTSSSHRQRCNVQAEGVAIGHGEWCPLCQGRARVKQSCSTDPLHTGLAITAFTVQQCWVLWCGLEMKTWTEGKEGNRNTNMSYKYLFDLTNHRLNSRMTFLQKKNHKLMHASSLVQSILRGSAYFVHLGLSLLVWPCSDR